LAGGGSGTKVPANGGAKTRKPLKKQGDCDKLDATYLIQKKGGFSMSNEEFDFRTATFGGFQRTDVVSYLKRIAEEHRQEVDKLQKQIDDLESRRSALQEQLAVVADAKAKLTLAEEQLAAQQEENGTLQAENDTLKQENQTLQEQLQAYEAAEEETREKQPQLEADLAALREENQALQEKNQALEAQLVSWEPSVHTYGAIKSQMAEIELDARERSALLLHRAEGQAEQLRSRAAEVLTHSAEQYDHTRMDTNQTLTYLCRELQRLQGELKGLSTVLDCDGASLFALSRGELAENDTENNGQEDASHE
jgi:DNA repair exonuclease SbcCD ATPase subunit